MKRLLGIFLSLQKIKQSSEMNTYLKSEKVELDVVNHPVFGKRIVISDGNSQILINMDSILRGRANAL